MLCAQATRTFNVAITFFPVMQNGPSKEESIVPGKISFAETPAACFVCGKRNAPINWAFDTGAVDVMCRIAEWFPLPKSIHIPYEGLGPNKIEVRVGSCRLHFRNLKKLRRLSLVQKKLAVGHVRGAREFKVRAMYLKKVIRAKEESLPILIPSGKLALA